MDGIIINDIVYRAFDYKPQHKEKGKNRCKMCIFTIVCLINGEKNKPCQGFKREVYFSRSPTLTDKLNSK